MPIVGAQAYENSIINALAVSDPQMNTALGTPIRKIITAVAQELAAYNVDVNVTNTLYSIESVSGIELDYLVGQFGFTRHSARAARGSVSIYRDNGDSLMQIPYGTYIYKPATSSLESVAFQTTAYQEMAEGVLSCEIAIVAVEAGSLGNVPANTITYFGSATDYMSITNENPTSGGRDAETDEQLRRRFLLTVFRNVAGTSDQILGLALAHAMVNKANLVGQESRYSETVQVTSLAGELATATASVSNEKWELDVDHCLDVDRRYWVRLADTQELLSHGDYKVSADGKTITFHTRNASDIIGPVKAGGIYQLSHKNITTIEIVDNASGATVSPSNYTLDREKGTISAGNSVSSNSTWAVTYKYHFVGDGEFVIIEFDYFSKYNRGGIKTVDLYVDCLAPKNVTDVQYVDFSKVITAQNAVDWQHDDGGNPTPGHIYVPLSYQPMFSSSGFISMGTSIILSEGTHYKMMRDVTKTKGSCRGMDAIEILGTVQGTAPNQKLVFDSYVDPSHSNMAGDVVPTNVPAGSIEIDNDTPIAIPYLYDYPVEDVQKLIDSQRIVTMDVQVHEASHRYFVIYLSLMFSTFPKDSIINTVKNNIMAWAEPLPFGYTIQLSDIETIAANTFGVDNVRTAIRSDAGGKLAPYHDKNGHSPGAYGILELQRDGSTFMRQFTNDFRLAENEVFEVADVVIYPRTQQRWGS